MRNRIRSLFGFSVVSLVPKLKGIILLPFLATFLAPEKLSIISSWNSLSMICLYIVSFGFNGVYSIKYFKDDDKLLPLEMQKLMIAVAFPIILFISTRMFGLVGVLLPFIVSFGAILSIIFMNYQMTNNSKSYSAAISLRAFLDLILAVLLIYLVGYKGRMIALLLSTIGVFIFIKLYFKNVFLFFDFKSGFKYDHYTFKKAIPFVLITLITYSSLELDKLVFLDWLTPHEHGVYSLNSRLALLSLAAYEILSREYFRDLGVVIKENDFILFCNYLKSKIIPIYCILLLFFLFNSIVFNGLVYNDYLVSAKYLMPQILVIFSLNIFKLFYSYLSINHLQNILNKLYISFVLILLLVFSVSMVFENVLSFLYGLVMLNFLLSVLIFYYVDRRTAV